MRMKRAPQVGSIASSVLRRRVVLLWTLLFGWSGIYSRRNVTQLFSIMTKTISSSHSSCKKRFFWSFNLISNKALPTTVFLVQYGLSNRAFFIGLWMTKHKACVHLHFVLQIFQFRFWLENDLIQMTPAR